MPLQILATKLHIPSLRPTAGLVPRPRLLERLDEGLPAGRKLTLVSAPAGFGKTTLVGEWLHALTPIPSPRERGEIGVRAAWLSLDDSDDDPAHFLSYLVAALEQIVPDLAQPEQETSPPAEILLTGLINQVAALSPASRLVIVLDDYHLVEAVPIHQAMTFLLDHLPPQLHLVITTRTDPPLPLARLRGQGQLIELREADLRFTPEETATFLNQVMRLNLTASDIATLDSCAEGWIVGLQLAALSLQGQPDKAGFLQAFTGSHRHILDYLAAEVLKRQPAHIQTFLQQTSILERLTGPLCDAVLGGGAGVNNGPAADSRSTLEYLERANLFVVPLDDERRWYRYHHLFAEFLQAGLQREQPHLLPELHRRAAAWYRRSGLLGDAIHHALAAADFDLAADLIGQESDGLLKRGELRTLREWLEALPADLLYARPALCLLYGWILLFNLRLDDVEHLLQEATPAFERQPLPPGLTSDEIAAEIAAMRVWFAVFLGDLDGSVKFARQALDYPNVKSPFVRSLIAFNQIFPALLDGDVPAAERACAEAVRVSREAGNVLVAVVSMCQQAELAAMVGQLHRAAEIYRQALPLAQSPEGLSLPTAGPVHMGLSAVLYEWNDLEAAARHLVQGIELIKQIGEAMAQDGYIVLARLKQAQGDPTGALEAMQCAEETARSTSTELDNKLIAAHRVRLWLRQGNLDTASQWARDYCAAADRLQQPYTMREFTELTLARVYLAQRRPTEALRLLLPLLQPLEMLRRTTPLIEALILQAIAYHLQDDSVQAVATLARALSLSEPEGYVRIFVDEGEPAAELLREVQAVEQDEGMKDYVGQLLAAFSKGENGKKTPARAVGANGAEASPTLSSELSLLSERELDVLRLIAAGKSNQEIAQTLVVATSTIKKHLDNIYGKLDVHSRTQALVRAKELGLL